MYVSPYLFSFLCEICVVRCRSRSRRFFCCCQRYVRSTHQRSPPPHSTEIDSKKTTNIEIIYLSSTSLIIVRSTSIIIYPLRDLFYLYRLRIPFYQQRFFSYFSQLNYYIDRVGESSSLSLIALVSQLALVLQSQ